jgi:hypothetical protein
MTLDVDALSRDASRLGWVGHVLDDASDGAA